MSATAVETFTERPQVREPDACQPSTSDRPAAGGLATGRRYLCYFIHHLLDFRRAEIDALAALAGCRPEEVAWEAPLVSPTAEPEAAELSPFIYITLPSEEAARRIMERSLLAKVMIEVWGEGSTFEELQEAITAFPDELKEPWMQPEQSFRITVEGYGFHCKGNEEVHSIIERLHFLPMKGKVRLSHPDVKFSCLVAEERRCRGVPCVGNRIVFGRQVATSDRSAVNRYSLTQRAYLGPTSMDAEVALLMCNQACVRPGSFVFDPFVGTGSILIAAAHYGAKVLGGDIDLRVLREGKKGKGGQTVNPWSNFEQYGLPDPLGLVRMDAHKLPFRRELEELFHAIVCDPPYGVRAGGRKSAHKPEALVRNANTHIPSTEPYTLTECLGDLLDMAARLLVVGGRLVYFLPSLAEDYTPDEVPLHPMLQLLANSEQILSSRYSRRLITMVKVRAYDASDAAAHAQANAGRVMAIDELKERVNPADPEAAAAAVGPKRRFRSKLL